MVRILTCQEKRVEKIKDFSEFKDEPIKGLVWLDFFNPSEAELDGLARVLSLHPVTRERLSRASNRPRFSDYSRYFSMTIHIPGGRLDQPHSHEIDIVVGRNWIVTVHELRIKGLDKTIKLCEENIVVMTRGSDYFLQEMLETLHRSYLPLLGWLDNKIEALENRLLTGKMEDDTVRRITELRNSVSGIRRTLMPQAEVFSRLSRKGVSLIEPDNQAYYHDLYQILMQTLDTIDRFRESLTHIMDLYMNQTSQRMNQIMKVLTIWATIFLPLTFLTGIWGMNFQFMPELIAPWGYWGALGLMVVVAVVMIVVFKIKKWL
ncbi:magnesium/cobalt transporter CorA [candidate division WOR-3 bacterium]|uniref:Magnesium transport protein CorA n=1 Tax=candidate division WOR-3 bacterium TaxID=2052148 RepID=A0A9D5QCG0_UNCW3|nr:magnesium/cobalt transporter CorA [candidate division WOR-3 bacterium]MBD3364002.1 magnesium/cobalt transporter CorA [candidate division WOR-3 bacterium]